ncbi:unnamed protein product [Cylindrotheca closterium]|uniref:CRAL-TRIO domain-containing protein n=1 Tax=Cylindrotheca closterium TaxID=2856 RepID=A0AAD2FGT9_9STRA|nr:unnamed protein product [Cylindrotheca closterium]
MTSIGVANQAIHASVADEKKVDDIAELAKETSKLSVSQSRDTKTAFEYSDEEMEAIQAVYEKLTKEENMEGSKIGLRALALTTIVSKLRVDEASEKYSKFLKALKTVDIDGIAFSDTEVDTYMGNPQVATQLAAYAVCGEDNEGRSIFWIKGKEILPGDETQACHAGVLYWLAIHADDKSLHEGITFCIDTSTKTSMSKHGNESKLQKINQSYPLRPQSIKIAGASMVMRVAINGLLKVASLFTKQKILQRIQFVTVKQALESIPKESAPKYLGGEGGNIESEEAWIAQRIHSFPIPEIKR